MKKALLVIIAILALSFLIGNSQMIMDFAETVKTGALVPLALATFFMVLRHIIQAVSYDAAFEAVGHKTGVKHNLILIFSLVFINTFCLFSGATGLAFIIDDAHREGMDIGRASTGSVLTQLAFFAAVAIIAIAGTVAMFVTGSVNPIFVTGGGILACVLIGQTLFLFLGFYAPKLLTKLFEFIEKILRWVYGKMKKTLSDNWGATYASSFIDSSQILAKNPLGIFYSIAWASASALCNMACMICIGFAFGFTNLPSLIAAFAVGVVSIMLSPTPQGIGFTEVFIVAILGAYGCSVSTAAAIALVYRGIMLWIPFVVGAFLLSQSGFFKDKKDPTVEQKAKDTAWVCGTLMGIIGIVCIALFVNPSLLSSYEMLVQFVDYRNFFIDITILVLGIVMLLCAVGLIKRYRTFWALSIALLTFILGTQFYMQAMIPCIPVCILLIALFAKRDCFDKPTALAGRVLKKRQETLEGNDKMRRTPMSALSEDIDAFKSNYRESHPHTGETGKLYSKIEAVQYMKVIAEKAPKENSESAELAE